MEAFKRPVFEIIRKRMEEKRRFIQILAGPRQVGKTTLARQLVSDIDQPYHYVSADEPTLRERGWIENQWDICRLKTEDSSRSAILIIDEVQKLPDWSESVKFLWDEDTQKNIPLKVILLGSSPLLLQKGLTESLAGRFELIPVTHWSFSEMHSCFGFSPDQYVFYGGYPGAAELIDQPHRWRNYIRDSLIETTVSRDILLMSRVDKPALLRRLFYLACEYSSQIVSYQKMLGQLHDAGNTTTLAHYLELLSGAGLVTGLNKYSGKTIRRRSSSPKLMALNTALINALTDIDLQEARSKGEYWGRITESAVGAHLINTAEPSHIDVFYWLNRNREVDFVLKQADRLTAIEVKSHHKQTSLSGLDAFGKAFTVTKKLLVGGQGIPLEEFLSKPAKHWM